MNIPSNFTMPTQGGQLTEVGRDKTVELIQTYCSAINHKVIIILGIAMFMWLLESRLRKMVDKKLHTIYTSEPQIKEMADFIFVTYKLLGLGLIFMAMFSIWWV